MNQDKEQTVTTRKWDFAELRFQVDDNPKYFTEAEFYALFSKGNCQKKVRGFYDDHGVFILRFLAEETGTWQYETHSTVQAIDRQTGAIEVKAPADGVHGLVRVDPQNPLHFAYSDGTPYYPFGTTAYVWHYQTVDVQKETLETLAKAPFNKLRMCVFPKHYDYNLREPKRTPFLGNIKDGFDFTHFDTVFFHQLETQILALQKLHIEVDLILFHPYDRWGFAKMTEAQDLRYASYVIARLSAFRNIWWSLANEYDLLTWKRNDFWDKLFCHIEEEDPYTHLRSIHNWHCPTYHYRDNTHWYDMRKAWVTHASIQHHDMHFIPVWREKFQKPIVIDECRYEGNMDLGWGNLPGRKMVDLFWQCVVQGGYATHGETFVHKDEILWWAHGGRLIGESPKRIAFLRQLIEEGIPKRLIPYMHERHWDASIGYSADKSYWLIYFGESCPAYRHLDMLPEGKTFHADIIDVWNMTLTPVEKVYKKNDTIQLYAREYIAVRLWEVK